MELLDTASIATVYRKSMDTDFDSILKIADTEMYKQKKKYYKNIKYWIKKKHIITFQGYLNFMNCIVCFFHYSASTENIFTIGVR